MRFPLSDSFPANVVFIIDGLMAAYTVAVLCAGRSIRCIYECKEVEWREVNFVALYDLLLSNVELREKRIEYVPHPYFLQGNSLLETIKKQQDFIQTVRKTVTLNVNDIYCGCVTSSILISNKSLVPHILMDEGMDSIMARHRLYSAGRSKLSDKVREILAGWLIPFRFHRHTPQVTMAMDQHTTIVLSKDYRDFRSHRFDELVAPLLKQLSESRKHVMVLVKGPQHMAATPLLEKQEDCKKYVEFNLVAIKRFISLHPRYTQACFYLKTHPSLGVNPFLTNDLIVALRAHSITAKSIWKDQSFDELPSIPAEAYLSTGKFNALLCLDTSSTLWHVGRDTSLECYMPLEEIMSMAKHDGSEALLPLFAAQRELNRVTRSNVIFY
jgi:hypothetical protein